MSCCNMTQCSFMVKCGNSQKGAHPPLCQTCKVLHPWALFRETTVYTRPLCWDEISRLVANVIFNQAKRCELALCFSVSGCLFKCVAQPACNPLVLPSNASQSLQCSQTLCVKLPQPIIFLQMTTVRKSTFGNLRLISVYTRVYSCAGQQLAQARPHNIHFLVNYHFFSLHGL